MIRLLLLYVRTLTMVNTNDIPIILQLIAKERHYHNELFIRIFKTFFPI